MALTNPSRAPAQSSVNKQAKPVMSLIVIGACFLIAAIGGLSVNLSDSAIINWGVPLAALAIGFGLISQANSNFNSNPS